MSDWYLELYEAWRNFRRGKRASREICKFEYHLERNLWELAEAVADGQYRHSRYRRAVVTEKKRRDLAVAAVRDRVVHR